MTLEQALAWIVAANTIVTFATTAYNLLSSRATKALANIEAIEGKLDEYTEKHQREQKVMDGVVLGRFSLVEERLLKMEAEMRHLPDRQQTHAIQLDLTKLVGRIDTLDERLRPIQATSERLQDFLLEHGK